MNPSLKIIVNLFTLAIFIFSPALGSTHDQSWKTALKQAVEARKQSQEIPPEELSGCHVIRVFMDNDNKLVLGHTVSDRLKFAYEIAVELGVVDHLAPQVSINGVQYEKFIRLFDTPADEEMMEDDSVASRLKAIRGKHGDLSLYRLSLELGKQKHKTLSKTEIEELYTKYEDRRYWPLVEKLGKEEIPKILNLVDAGSMDELFLHHILTSASDSAERNFLLQYRGGKLHLVRIDYGDSLFDNTERFLGEGLLTALTTPFSAKGRQIIDRLSNSYRDLTPRKAETLKKLMQTSRQKSIYLERINALKFMNDAGFFEHNHRAHTMLALYYLGLRDQLDQNSATHSSWIDTYWGSAHYDIVDNEGQSLKDFVGKLKKAVNNCIIDIHSALYSPPTFKDSLFSTRRLFPTRKPFNDVIIKQAVESWIKAKSVSDLPGFKEFLQPNEDPFSLDHLTSWRNITSTEAQRQRIQAIPYYFSEAYSEPLSSDIWEQIREDIRSCLGEKSTQQDFVSITFRVIMKKEPTSYCSEETKEQWKSFMQQSFGKRAETNELWKTFLQNCDSFGEFKKDIALPVRVLEIARMFEEEQANAHRYASFINSKEIEDMQTIQLTLLATGGTFGMNFNRTANLDEAAIMIKCLHSLGKNLQRSMTGNSHDVANEISNVFFLTYSTSNLNQQQKSRLKDHHLNCATIALHAVFKGDFDAIDDHLRSKGIGSSKQRYTQIMRMAGRSVEGRDEF